MKEESITNEQPQCLKLHANGIIRYATFSEIIFLKADNNYTHFLLNDLSKFTMCKTLNNFEMNLGSLFFRCHKSYLINSLHVKEVDKRNKRIILASGETIPISRNKLKMLENKLNIKTLLRF